MTKKEYMDVLEAAYEVVGVDDDFVNSCENFLNNKGFLSEGQIKALKAVKPRRNRDDDAEFNGWRWDQD